MNVMNKSKNVDQIEKVTRFEADTLYQRWKDPNFMQNLKRFMSELKKKERKMNDPKL